MRRRRGFTLVDLLALLALIPIVIIVGCNIIGSAVADSEKTVCMTKLATTGDALAKYAAANGGKFARVHSEGDPLAAPTADKDLKSISTNAMNQVWPLVDEGLLPSTAFRCPADRRPMVSINPALLYGWANASEFSYGIQYPFDHDPAGKAANPACPASGAYNGDWILMADRNPGKRVTSITTWPNHHDGCVYLKMDGSVFFHEDSNSVILGQEIYGDDNVADGNIFPDSAGDVVILPNAPAD